MGKSMRRAIMATLREFVIWLSQQDGFRRRVKLADAEYFPLCRCGTKPKRARPLQRPAPSIKQAKRALAMMPDELRRRDLRDKAIFSLLCLTGIRVQVHLSRSGSSMWTLNDKSITQNPREVATKRGKSIDTFFAKGFPEAEDVLAKWLTHLDDVALYSPDDPLFPATAVRARGTERLQGRGLSAPELDLGPNRSARSSKPPSSPQACRRSAHTPSDTCLRGTARGPPDRSPSLSPRPKPRPRGCSDDLAALRPNQPRRPTPTGDR